MPIWRANDDINEGDQSQHLLHAVRGTSRVLAGLPSLLG